ncbi:MAG: ABC transporter six-transmembrane domain-containing protein [Pseudomonadota bacterium]|nr:ABC transporter six-transmembrane domain-containing protein [Pseudomonadota bacterium]
MVQHASHFSTDYSLWGIFVRFRWSILGTFSLVVVENLIFIAQPYLIGKTVDGLIAGNYFELKIFMAVALVHACVTTFRMGYDDRTYARIRSQLSIETVMQQQRANSSLSETAERTALCDEILGFFERGLFVIVKSAVEIVGAMVMLAFIDWRICVAAFCSMVVSQLIWISTRSRVKALFTLRNDQREKKVQEIESGDYQRISGHFGNIARLKIKLSDYEAFSFGAFELMGIVVFFYAAFVATNLEGVTAGVLVACFGYVKALNNATTRLPNIFHAIVGVNEISGRLQALVTPGTTPVLPQTPASSNSQA